METDPEYAELYSFKERLRFVLIGVTVGGAVWLLWNQWALPRWREFAEQSPCVEVWGLSGTAVLFYALFVGFPLLFALGTAGVLSRRGLKILRDKQVPYLREKVFRPTRIRRGRAAVLIGWAHVLSPTLFIALALWGAPKADALIEQSQTKTVDPAWCESRVTR